jgi:hypothetical protein
MQGLGFGRVYPGWVCLGMLLNVIGQMIGSRTTGAVLSKVDIHMLDFLHDGLYLN